MFSNSLKLMIILKIPSWIWITNIQTKIPNNNKFIATVNPMTSLYKPFVPFTRFEQSEVVML